MNWKDLIAGFQALSLDKKILFFFVFLSIVGAISLFGFFTNQPDFRVLYSNLEEEEASKIIAKLQEENIPYRITGGGRAIEVPEDQVYELRMVMAGDGLASKGGVIGFEIFDQDSWSTSRFVQQINYRRALQGELIRTITSVAEVESARVHLVLPERSPFLGAQEARPKASVVLKIRGKRRLSPAQVKGIVYLVSGSVDNLLPDDVSVIDTDGKLLTVGGKQDEDMSSLSSYQLEYRRSLENNFEKRVTQMLEQVHGQGNVIIRVTAEVDFKKLEQQEELFDPDSVVVRSEQKMEEKVGAAAAANIPGLTTNLPGRGGTAPAIQGVPSEKKEKVLNYEINKVVKRLVEAPGAIKRLSAAVLIRKQDNMEGSELEGIAALVKRAIGYKKDRGDQVEVAFMPFAKKDEKPEELPEPGFKEFLERFLPLILKYGALVFGVLLLVFAVFRPLLNNLAEDGKRMAEFQKQIPESLEKMDKSLPEETERDRLIALVREDPAKAAQVIKMWLREA